MMHETGTGVDPTAALIKHVLFPAWVRKNRSTRLAYLEQFERRLGIAVSRAVSRFPMFRVAPGSLIPDP